MEKYLVECLDSLVSQTYENFEVILIDDGSKDKSGVICDEYKAKYDNFKVIHGENGGLSYARNIGIANARGAYISFIDSDDYINNNFIHYLVNMIEYSQSDLAISKIVNVQDEGTVIEERFKNNFTDGAIIEKDFAMKLLADEIKLSTCAWNKLYKRELFENICFPVGKLYEDKFIMHEIFHKCNRLVISKEAVYFYRTRPNSITNSLFSKSKFDFFEAIYIRMVFYSKNYPLYCKKIRTNFCENAVWIYKDAKKNGVSNEYERILLQYCKDYMLYYALHGSRILRERLKVILLFYLSRFGLRK